MLNTIEIERAGMMEKHAKDMREIEARTAIYNAMPEGVPVPYSLFSGAYKGDATVTFTAADSDLQDILDLLPAMPLVLAKGSFTSILPESVANGASHEGERVSYTKIEPITWHADWFDAKTGKAAPHVEWYTLIAGNVVHVHVKLSGAYVRAAAAPITGHERRGEARRYNYSPVPAGKQIKWGTYGTREIAPISYYWERAEGEHVIPQSELIFHCLGA